VIQLAFREMPEKWRHVIERATDPLPRHRYPDARALKDALLELADGELPREPVDRPGP
jgi:hypothetical protein